MTDPNEQLAGDTVPKRSPQRNRGWFRPGDQRINREGRPTSSTAAALAGRHPSDFAPRADRLKRMLIRERVLLCCLVQPKAPWVVFPKDFSIVDCRFDVERRGVVFVIRSDGFPQIAKGALIPEIEPGFYGLIYC